MDFDNPALKKQAFLLDPEHRSCEPGPQSLEPGFLSLEPNHQAALTGSPLSLGFKVKISEKYQVNFRSTFKDIEMHFRAIFGAIVCRSPFGVFLGVPLRTAAALFVRRGTHKLLGYRQRGLGSRVRS